MVKWSEWSRNNRTVLFRLRSDWGSLKRAQTMFCATESAVGHGCTSELYGYGIETWEHAVFREIQIPFREIMTFDPTVILLLSPLGLSINVITVESMMSQSLIVLTIKAS